MEVLWLIGGFLVVCIAIGLWLAPKWNRFMQRQAQKERERVMEAQMRQDIRDHAAQKRIATKLLREAGERP